MSTENKADELLSVVVDINRRLLCKCTECDKEFSDGLVFKSAYDEKCRELIRFQKLYSESWNAFTNYIGDESQKSIDGIRSVKIKELQQKNAELKAKIEKMKEAITNEVTCADCVEAIGDGFTICGDCSCE